MASESKYIVLIGPAHPLRGGLATYNQLLATKLQEAGHRVKIVSFKLQYPKILFPGKTQYSSDPKPEHLNITQEINSVNPINWLIIGNKLKNEKPDLVIFRYWLSFMAPCLGSIARLIHGNNFSKIVAITDNIIPHERKWFDTPLTRYFLKSCDGFVTMSRAVLADLEKFKLNKPALFNPHPMYESFGKKIEKSNAKEILGLSADANYLLFFGFIRQYKGLDLLLEAFADERLRKHNVKLIIAGEYYEDSQRYKDIIQKLNLEEELVQHNDFIPDTEVHQYFSACDMVVQTYKDATQSGVTQVAYYYDKPMLVTNVGGLAELVPHGKVGYVCPVDVQEIADALVDFYEGGREAEFAQAVAVEKQKFKWEPMIESLITVSGLAD